MQQDPPNTAGSCGIYILANDRVLEYAIALFHSLRYYNPDIPAFIIPFDDRMEKITEEARAFNIGVYDAPGLKELDAMASACFGEEGIGKHVFRRLAAYWGPLETFFYLDVDIVLLDDPAVILEEFAKADCDFLSFDNDESRVYLPGPVRKRMQKEFGSKSFNSGAYVSRRGLFDFPAIERLAKEASKIKKHFAIYGDQTFVNYIVDVSRLRHRRLPELNDNYPDKQWGDQVPIVWKHGAYRLLDKKSPDYNKPVPFIHWAGHGQFDHFPNRHLFYHFRLLDASKWDAFKYKLADRRRWAMQPVLAAGRWLQHKFQRLLQKFGIH